MDRAVLRPGRLGKLLYVPLPNQEEHGLILKAIARKKPLDVDVDLTTIGRSEACANLSGADLSALMNEATMAAVEEKFRKLEGGGDEGTSSSGGMPHTIKAIHLRKHWENFHLSSQISKNSTTSYCQIASKQVKDGVWKFQ